MGTSLKRKFALITSVLGLGVLAGTPALAQIEPEPQPSDPTEAPIQQQEQADQDIVALASENESFNTFVQALEAAGLQDQLATGGPYTVFAPTDEAFSQLPDQVVDLLLQPENQDLLRQVLSYHVLPAAVPAENVQAINFEPLENGFYVVPTGDRVLLNGANLVEENLNASNGVIHGIDRVLIPSEVEEQVLAQLAQEQGMQPQEQPQAAMPSTEAPQQQAQIPEEAQPTEQQNTLLALASQSDSFNTLVQAVEAAGLQDQLETGGPYTIFAPTDEAFAQLPEGALDYLLQPENQDLLREVLTYHVVPGTVTSQEIEPGTIDALGGGLAIALMEDRIVVNNASVVEADLEASNGVIHAVNRVLLPAELRQRLEDRLAETY